MSKINLIASIKTKYDASALFAQTGALFFGDAPDTANRPMCVLNEITSAASQTTSSWDDETTFQFTIFSASNSPKECYTLYGLLIAEFDNAVISVTGGNLVSFVRQSEVPLRDPDGDGWQYSTDYRAHYERQK